MAAIFQINRVESKKRAVPFFIAELDIRHVYGFVLTY